MPPPFTILSIVVLIFQLVADRKTPTKDSMGKKDPAGDESGIKAMIERQLQQRNSCTDQTYSSLIFSLIESAKAETVTSYKKSKQVRRNTKKDSKMENSSPSMI